MDDVDDVDAKQGESRLAEARSVLHHSARAFGLLWQVSPGRTLAYALVTIVDALLPAAIAYVAKHIVDSVVAGSLDATLTWVGVADAAIVYRPTRP